MYAYFLLCHFSRFPYVNEAAELNWPLNAQSASNMQREAAQNHVYIYKIADYCLGNFCIESKERSWLLSGDVTNLKCTHEGKRFVFLCHHMYIYS